MEYGAGAGPELAAEPALSHLPWGAYRERTEFPDTLTIGTNTKSGEFILQTLFGEFTVLAEKKINNVLESGVSDPLYLIHIWIVLRKDGP